MGHVAEREACEILRFLYALAEQVYQACPQTFVRSHFRLLPLPLVVIVVRAHHQVHELLGTRTRLFRIVTHHALRELPHSRRLLRLHISQTVRLDLLRAADIFPSDGS